jgi:DNA-binding CsgD family transcriptional regulator
MASDRAIDRFFEAALNPEDWPAVLDDVARSLDADGATLIFGPATRDTLIESTGIRAYVADYFANGLNFDPREKRVFPDLDDGFLADARHFTEDEIAHDPFYRYLRKHKLGWHAVACLARGPAPIVLSLKRGARRGHFQRSELDKLDALLPHLRAATEAARLTWSTALDDQLATLDRVGCQGLLLDRNGLAMTISPALKFGDGLDLIGRAPVASFPADQPALETVVRIATHREPPSALPAPPVAVLRRPSGRRPLLARAMPLHRARLSLLAPAVAVLLVSDLDTAPRPALEVVRSVFGLTHREAELAVRLAAGDTLDQAAAALGITSAHARQRLKVIFDKAGTCRQSELIVLLQRLA